MPRVALMIPQRNATLEPESYQVVPPGTSVHFARLPGSVMSEELLQQLSVELESAWDTLVDLRPQVVAFACTSGSFYGGRAGEERIRKKMEDLTQRPFITTSQAVIMACKALQLKRLAVVTPYADWVNERLVTFLAEYGLETVALQGMGLSAGISDVDSAAVEHLLEAVDRPQAEGIFISCTALPTLASLAAWEQKVQKPVFSANLATLWLAFGLIKQPLRGIKVALTETKIGGEAD
ncbi:MAG: Asp/Glu racemase [Clostridia bacterium]|nr:Asp/Glu racemase [Clostridia bacterium]